MGIFKSRLEKRNYSKSNIELLDLLGINSETEDLGEITYFTCMRILTDTISKLPLKLFQETSDGTNKSTDHYLYHLLKLRPNKYMSSSDFWKAVEFNRNHYGHSIVYIDYDKNFKIRGLYPLATENIEIWIDDKGIINRDKAIWYINWTDRYKLKHDEVLHFKGLTKDGIKGISARDILRAKLESGKNGAKFVENYFKNGLFAKGIVQYTGDLSPENMNRLKDRFSKMAGGIDNAGKVLPMPLGFEFKELSEMMKAVEKNAPGRIEKKLNQITREVKEETQSKTPVKTGYLKKQFKTKKAKKVGTTYKSEVYNNAPHSHLIEDGHWFVVSRGPNKYKKIKWVDGFSMLSSSVEEKNSKIQKELEEWLPDVYKELEK